MPKKKKEVKIMKGKDVSAKKAASMRKKPGGSSVGDYTMVSKKDFAGPAGGSPKGSFPINTKKRAVSALKLAHNAPNPGGVRKAVMHKYPGLKKGSKK